MSVVAEQKSRFVDPDNLPPSPVYVFRGHVAEITAVSFLRNDSRLASGDTDGWIVVWDMVIRRPAAVWKAHESGILSIREWNMEKLVTHGRDGKVFVWRFGEKEEGRLDQGLPADEGIRQKPWLLHSLEVKEMTFCGIDIVVRDQETLVATSSGNLGELIDIYSLPTKDVHCSAIGKNPPEQLGMTMCLSILAEKDDASQCILAAGYESGHACLFKAHSQPVLSLALHPSQESFYTTSADSKLVQHPTALSFQPIKTVNTKHSGQTSLQVRDDGRIIVSAGWDGCGRIYSALTLKQVAVLKWHASGLQVAGFSKSGTRKRWIVLGGKDGKITLWDLFN